MYPSDRRIELPTCPLRLRRLRVGVADSSKAFVLTTYEAGGIIHIYIGSQYCYLIHLQLYRYADGVLYDGCMDWYDGEDPLELPFLLTYVSDSYPSVRIIYFTDTRRQEGIPMLMMKAMMDGKVPLEILDRRTYDQKMAKMQEAKEKMSAEEFMIHVPACALTRDEVAKKYSQSRTWQEFFTAMKGGLGMGAFCHWLAIDGWFEHFVRHHLTFAPEAIGFHFTPQRFPLTYQAGPMRGGGVRTRRRRRL